MTVDEASEPPVMLWPDNEMSVDVLYVMRSQWRVGVKGPTGLDYSALPAVMDLIEVPQGQRRQVFADLRLMEQVALDEIHKD